jgi:hypothetical protein
LHRNQFILKITWFAKSALTNVVILSKDEAKLVFKDIYLLKNSDRIFSLDEDMSIIVFLKKKFSSVTNFNLVILYFCCELENMSSPEFTVFLGFSLLKLTAYEDSFLLLTPDLNPSVVVSSIFKAGTSWSVSLARGKDILTSDTKILGINQKKVSAFNKKNGRGIIFKHGENGFYQPEIFPPLAYKTYERIVNIPEYQVVEANGNALGGYSIVNIITDIIGQNTTKVNVDLRDHINKYYIWNFISTLPKTHLDSCFKGNAKEKVLTIIRYKKISGYLNNPSSLNENDTVDQGSAFHIKISRTIGNGDEEMEKNPDGTGIAIRYVRLLTTSKYLYNGHNVVEKCTTTDNDNSSLSHSPEIYSDIKYGLEIIHGFTEEFKKVK